MGTVSVGFQNKMIIFIVAHLHGFEGVAMVSMGEGQNPGPPHFSAVDIILKRHFEGNFHSHTAGIGEKAVVKITGKPFLQPVRELLHRLVGQSAQHYMGEMFRLRPDGFCENRVFIAMDYTPPGRDGIDHPVVFGKEPDAFGIRDFIRVFHCLHLLVRVPDHGKIPP